MKLRLGKFAKLYFLSPWLPSVFAMTIFGLLFANESRGHVTFVSLTLLLALVASLLGMLVAAIAQLVRGRRLWGAINLIALPVIGLVTVRGIAFLLFAAMFNEEPDNFGKNIVIPADMKVTDPIDHFNESGESASDKLTSDIVATFTTPGALSGNTRISTDLKVLNEFATANRQKLIQHLSASARWFVTEEDGKPYAYRRLLIGESWQNSLHGFYSSFALAASNAPHFQTRIVIGFDGPVFADSFGKILTNARVGDSEARVRVIDDQEANQGKESYFVLSSTRASIEVFEQSPFDTRPITQLALIEIKRELEAALVSPSGVALPAQPALENSRPEIQLAKGMQGGIYHVRAFVNPGAPGRAYIKVFEATQNIQLS